MSKPWVRYTLTAEFLSDAHLGSGSGGGCVDALIARDRFGHPVIWASHVEGVLRDAARRLRGDEEAERFFGRSGGEQQRAVFTSLYAEKNPGSHIWCSTSSEGFEKDKDFYNRAPKDDTLRVIEYVPKGTKLVGEVELPVGEFPTLQRLVQEVDALGGGRSTGAGRVKLLLTEMTLKARKMGDAAGRLVLLLKNRDPLCITATATPDNLIPSLAFVPGRALLGSLAAWLIAENDRETASLFTSGKVSVSDALPIPQKPANLLQAEVLPSPLSLQSQKPKGAVGEVPWWARQLAIAQRIDGWSTESERLQRGGVKLKRPEDDLFVYRGSENEAWTAFKPVRRVRLRNGRSDSKQVDASLFSIEQIVEDTYFLAEIRGALGVLKQIMAKLAPVLQGERWLRLGRAGAPVEVAQVSCSNAPVKTTTTDKALLTLTSDLLVRDEYLRWITNLSQEHHPVEIKALFGDEMQLGKSLQDSVRVHGFNGTSRLWRMPASAIRRGSIFEVSGPEVAKLAERAAKGEWLGERTHEGFGRFRIDLSLPGETDETPTSTAIKSDDDVVEEGIAATTKNWFDDHKALVATDKKDRHGHKPPSLSQWLDLVADLARHSTNAFNRSNKNWKHGDAEAVLNKLKTLPQNHALHAHFFVRWLRAEMRTERYRKLKESP